MSARILVVDDNVVNLKLACEVLESAGYVVDRAADAEQAEAVLAISLPDLILMDIALPGMDGLTLTRKLKSLERTAAVPVVALTAFAMKGDDRRALDAGCNGYITKPIDTRRLAQQVDGYLRPPTPALSGPLRVLLIEDDVVDRKLMESVLAASGFRVQQRVSADGVTEIVLTDPPDVILLDLRLPGIDGRAIALRLKADPRTREIPIVAVTAFPEAYSVTELAEAGCELCIVKPVDTRQLPKTLEGLSKRHPQQPRPRIESS